ncbi:MAG: hypothetical protein KKB34_10315 [Bacteroidetes bacterium]|nr:hypothetical protein [Bacteroidota bacterium]
MLELLFSLIAWSVVYVLEIKSDLMGNKEKMWDAFTFAALHVTYGLTVWYYNNFVMAFSLTLVSIGVRLVVHNRFANIWRGKKITAPFTVDGPDDLYDKFTLWFETKFKLSFFYVELLFLCGAVTVHLFINNIIIW